MTTFHFSAGDCNDGPVGFCAEVKANTELEALEKLVKALPECYGIELDSPAADDIVYCNVYFNVARLSITDIDEAM
jgi:hypothetical protein